MPLSSCSVCLSYRAVEAKVVVIARKKQFRPKNTTFHILVRIANNAGVLAFSFCLYNKQL